MTRWGSAAVLLFLAGCLDDRPFGATGPDDAGVTLTPTAFFLEPGSSLPLAAASRLPNAGTVRWTSSHPDVAEVSAAGVVTADIDYTKIYTTEFVCKKVGMDLKQ